METEYPTREPATTKAHALGRMIKGLDDKAIPLALERTLWQDAFLGKTSNNFTHSVCTNEDGITPCFS